MSAVRSCSPIARDRGLFPKFRRVRLSFNGLPVRGYRDMYRVRPVGGIQSRSDKMDRFRLNSYAALQLTMFHAGFTIGRATFVCHIVFALHLFFRRSFSKI